MKEAIKTYNLTKKYGKSIVLNNVNMTVGLGEIYGLVGENGAGKTTLLRIITGQGAATSGNFELLSKATDKEIIDARSRIGAIVENPSFYPKLSLEQNLEYYRIQRGVPDKKRVQKVLELVNLLEVKKKKYKDISLGMKQRLGLALAMLSEPEILILDEPINGLDPSGIKEIRNLLLRLNKEKNITIIISSHILLELANIATCYGFLSKGNLIEELTVEELHEKCKSYLEIIVDEPKKFAVLLEEKLDYKNYKIMPNGLIKLYEKTPMIEEISKLAVNNGIGLIGLTEKSIGLENYYMSMIGGE